MKNLIYLLLLPTLLGLACTEQPLAPDPSSVSVADTTLSDTTGGIPIAPPIAGVWKGWYETYTEVLTIRADGSGEVEVRRNNILYGSDTCYSLPFSVVGYTQDLGLLDEHALSLEHGMVVQLEGRPKLDTLGYADGQYVIWLDGTKLEAGSLILMTHNFTKLSDTSLLYYEDFSVHDVDLLYPFAATEYEGYLNAGPAAVEECNGYHAEMVGAEIQWDNQERSAYAYPFVKGLKLKSLDVANGQRVELTFKCDQEHIEAVQTINEDYVVFVDYGAGFKADSVTLDSVGYDGLGWYTYRGEFDVPAGCSVYSVDIEGEPAKFKIDDIKLVALPSSTE